MFKCKKLLWIVLVLVTFATCAFAATLVVRRFDKLVIGPGANTTTGAINLASGTAAPAGIYFGSDTNLYRSAANTLKTDDALNVAGTLTVGGVLSSTTTPSVETLDVSGATTLAGAAALNGNTTLGNAATDTFTLTGRLILRTLGADPLHATPGSRPAGSAGEIAIYSGAIYLCTNATTPTWVLVGPAG